MAIIYVRSTDGNNADSGATWALAKADLVGALAIAAAGDTIYVSDNHAESTVGSITLTSAGTAASPINILCADDAAEPPTALATTGTVTVTGNNAAITYAGYAYVYGLTFTPGGTGGGANHNASTSGFNWTYESCKIVLASTGNSQIQLGVSSANEVTLKLINSTLKFNAVGQTFTFTCGRFDWFGGGIDSSGSAPTVFCSAPNRPATLNFENVDLSHLGSGKSLFAVTSVSGVDFQLSNCKLGSSVSVASGSFAARGGAKINLVNCDSGDTNYRTHKSQYEGDITNETTIVRTGGATDGVTAVSRKMVSSAGAKFAYPLTSNWQFFWNFVTGSAITVAIPVLTDNVTLTDAEAWIEVSGLGTSGFPLGTSASDRGANILTTGTNQTTDSISSWVTTGFGTPVKQILSTTFTPQEIGFMAARVCLAKASTTMYFDPAPVDANHNKYGQRQYITSMGNVVQEKRHVRPNLIGL